MDRNYPIQLPNKLERHKLFGSVEPGEKTKPTEKEKKCQTYKIRKKIFFVRYRSRGDNQCETPYPR